MRFPTSITASPGLDGGDDDDDESSSSDSEERLWASSARMASAMALPSMTFPRDAAAAGGAASSGSMEDDDMAKKGSVVMQVDGGKVDDVGLEGGSLLS